jgi:hypothetical protein
MGGTAEVGIVSGHPPDSAADIQSCPCKQGVESKQLSPGTGCVPALSEVIPSGSFLPSFAPSIHSCKCPDKLGGIRRHNNEGHEQQSCRKPQHTQ